MCTPPKTPALECGCPLGTCPGWLQLHTSTHQPGPPNLCSQWGMNSPFPISSACFPLCVCNPSVGGVPLSSLRVHSNNKQQNKAYTFKCVAQHWTIHCGFDWQAEKRVHIALEVNILLEGEKKIKWIFSPNSLLSLTAPFRATTPFLGLFFPDPLLKLWGKPIRIAEWGSRGRGAGGLERMYNTLKGFRKHNNQNLIREGWYYGSVV